MKESLQLRIGAIFVLAVVSLLGIMIPLVIPKDMLRSDFFNVLKSSAAGVMLGLALIHLLPEANEGLQEVYPDYPLCFMLTGVGLIVVLIIEQLVTAFVAKGKNGTKHEHHSITAELSPSLPADQGTQRLGLASSSKSNKGCCEDIYCDGHQPAEITLGHDHQHQPVFHSDIELAIVPNHDHGHDHIHQPVHECEHTESTHCHDHAHVCNESEKCKESDTVCSAPHCHDHDHAAMAFQDAMNASSFRAVITAYALEVSTAIHSVIIGVGLGALENTTEVGILLAALSFHQFMEGMGLGAILASTQQQLGRTKIVSFVSIFTLVVPVGVVIGIFTSSQQDGNAQLTAQGVLTSLAAGAMLYSALIELTASIFNNPKLEDRIGLKSLMLLSYGLGYAALAIIGMWA